MLCSIACANAAVAAASAREIRRMQKISVSNQRMDVFSSSWFGDLP